MPKIATLAVAAVMASGAWLLHYPAAVVKIVDADTYDMKVTIWPQIVVETKIRLNGVDTPERFRPSKKCREKERALAAKATELVATAFKNAEAVYVSQPKLGKFAGRVVADVFLEDKQGRRILLSELLMSAGLADEYHGGHRDPDRWCGV